VEQKEAVPEYQGPVFASIDRPTDRPTDRTALKDLPEGTSASSATPLMNWFGPQVPDARGCVLNEFLFPFPGR
jgi:hypothetical protein